MVKNWSIKKLQILMEICNNMEKGLVHIYCGDGKGKTTCAAGLAIRCAGYNGKVLWFQFLKKDTSGERRSLEKLGSVELVSGYEKMKFTFSMTDKEKAEAGAFFKGKLKEIAEMVSDGNYDLLVMDEILGAITSGMIDEKSVIEFIKNKPECLEVVLTGRNPSSQLCEYADYVTEMIKVKHPYDKGIMAREKIEF